MDISVSLIVSFYNKIELLKFIFTALDLQTYRNFEVIIADDGSNPAIVDELNILIKNSSLKVKHVWHEDKGWRKNIILNKAIIAAQGDYLVFIDGDCIPHPRFIQEHYDSRKHNQVISGRRVTLTERISKKLNVQRIQNGYLQRGVFLILLFETVFKGKKTHLKHWIRINNKVIRKILIKEKLKGFWGCNFSIFKSDLLKVNGFDERYLYPGIGEDTDLDNRLRQVGVFPVSKKHSITEYHVHHIHFDLNYEPNKKLRDENLKWNIGYTPFGINKNNQ